MFDSCKYEYYDFNGICQILEEIPEMKDHLTDFKKMIWTFIDINNVNGEMINLPYDDILDEESNNRYSESVKTVVRFLEQYIGITPVQVLWY